jgi:uncharacterized protein YecE (DUF72 family)
MIARQQQIIRVGPAGWSYQDWSGIVYPSPSPPRFDRLLWLARLFDLIEVNVSFYRIPAARVSEGWGERLSDVAPFELSVKLHRSLTHGPRQIDADVVDRMRRFLRPLRRCGCLGPLLAQFPWSFRPSRAALNHLEAIREAFPEDAVVIELRNGDWERPAYLEEIERRGLSLVSVDQPRLGNALAPGAMPGSIAYVRLHGRNARNWFAPNVGRDARYDYLYGTGELQEWIPRIQALAARAGEVRVITNNHFRGQAVANALELRALLGQEVAEVPEGLLRSYPTLRERLAAAGSSPRPMQAPALPGPRQGELFE